MHHHTGGKIMNIITTSRLKLRPFLDTDIESYIKIMTNPAVTRYLGSGKEMTKPDVEKLLTEFKAVWDASYGVFAVFERVNGNLIGHCGIRAIPDGRVELLYAYDPTTWGKGYATEAGKAVLAYGEEHFSLTEVIGIAYPQNKGSVVVLEKLGFKHVGTEAHFGSELELLSRKFD